MNSSNDQRHIWTRLAFAFALLTMLHVMLIPVWYGLSAMNPFETDRSVVAAIPVWFRISGAAMIGMAILFLVVSKLPSDSHGQ
jgi:hypothetical protein